LRGEYERGLKDCFINERSSKACKIGIMNWVYCIVLGDVDNAVLFDDITLCSLTFFTDAEAFNYCKVESIWMGNVKSEVVL
jgi:hypothetical protein